MHHNPQRRHIALQYIESYSHATFADGKRDTRLRAVADGNVQERFATSPWSVERDEAVICRPFYCMSYDGELWQ